MDDLSIFLKRFTRSVTEERERSLHSLITTNDNERLESLIRGKIITLDWVMNEIQDEKKKIYGE